MEADTLITELDGQPTTRVRRQAVSKIPSYVSEVLELPATNFHLGYVSAENAAGTRGVKHSFRLPIRMIWRGHPSSIDSMDRTDCGSALLTDFGRRRSAFVNSYFLLIHARDL